MPIELTSKIEPKNAGFQGMVDDDQIIDTQTTVGNIMISDGTNFSSQPNPSISDHNLLTNKNWASAGHTIDTNVSFGGNNITDVVDILLDSISARGGAGDLITLNPAGLDVDLRVLGDGDPNLIRTIASSDRVMIGGNAPESKLEINTDTATEPVLIAQTTDDDNTNSIQEWQKSDGTLAGKVILGVTDGIGQILVGDVDVFTPGRDELMTLAKDGRQCSVVINSFNDAAGGQQAPFILLKRFRGSIASPAGVNVGDRLGGLGILGADSDGDNQLGAIVEAFCDGTPTATACPSGLAFTTGGNSGTRAQRLTMDSPGNFLFTTMTIGNNSVGVLGIGNGITPTSNPANMCHMYAKDVAGSSELHVLDELNNETVISTHAFVLFQPDPSYELPFSFYSKNPFIGREVNVDMFGAIREIEVLSGKKFIYLNDLPEEEKRDWNENQVSEKVKYDAAQVLISTKQRADYIYENTVGKLIEVAAQDAFETVNVTVWQDSEETETRYKVEDGNVISYQIPVKIKVETDVTKTVLKPGIQLDVKTGKFFREKVEADLIDIPDFTPKVQEIKGPPAWMEPLI